MHLTLREGSVGLIQADSKSTPARARTFYRKKREMRNTVAQCTCGTQELRFHGENSTDLRADCTKLFRVEICVDWYLIYKKRLTISTEKTDFRGSDTQTRLFSTTATAELIRYYLYYNMYKNDVLNRTY